MRSLALLTLLFVVACGSVPIVETTTTTIPRTTTGASFTSTIGSVTTTPQPGIGCPDGGTFVDVARVNRIDQPTSDTNLLGLFSWRIDAACERFEVDFETTEGAPATTPPTVVVDFLESRQILRVWTDVDSTVVTDQLVETNLVDRLYMVRAFAGGMFIDFHLKRPAQARAAVSNSPARLTLELQPGTVAFDSMATVSEKAVVISPGDGAETGTGVEIEGYARTFEANVLVIATIADAVVAEAIATATDWTETWGEFRTSIDLPPGQVSLFVGEESPEDGRLTGATLNLTVRSAPG